MSENGFVLRQYTQYSETKGHDNRNLFSNISNISWTENNKIGQMKTMSSKRTYLQGI